jgi:hypothetical protein
VSKGLLTPLNGVHDCPTAGVHTCRNTSETATTTHNPRHQHALSFRCLSATVPRVRELSLRSRPVSRRRRQARANSVLPLRQGHVPQGSTTEYSLCMERDAGNNENRRPGS